MSPADEQWLAARRIARELDRILDGAGPRRATVDRAAAELRLWTRQVYNLLARYCADRTVTSLLPRTAGTRKKRPHEGIEEIIAATLREQWLVLEAPPLAPVVAEIRARCQEASLAAPSYLTVARRIPLLFTPEIRPPQGGHGIVCRFKDRRPLKSGPMHQRRKPLSLHQSVLRSRAGL
ncbi:hypothetical protein X739_32355 [Mesorhizobium sp. LNHC220B00]|nr:hypothetical protein X739_32355 [Mesorhizobium sp. LNHC220B00]